MDIDTGMVLPDTQVSRYPQQHHQQRLRQQHRQIHRNRASYSCHSCRRRKVKCDRQHPSCGNCSKMVEQCVYSDNTGKGPCNKNRERKMLQQQHQQLVGGSSKTDPIAQNGFKRRRMDTPLSLLDTMPTGQSMASTMSDPMLGQFPPVPFQAHRRTVSDGNLFSSPSITPGGSDLENKVNHLAEIVDQWYKVACAKSASGSLGTNGPAQPTAHIEAALAQTIPRTVSSNAAEEGSLPHRQQAVGRHTVTSPSRLRNGDIPGRLPSKYGASTSAESGETDLQSSNEAEFSDLALGRLSIQEDGRSRYVGNSFWACLSTEVCHLLPSPSLWSFSASCADA